MLSADPVSYSVAFAAGFVSFASPCVLPLVPAYLGVVSGVGFDDFEKRRWAVFFPTLAFVIGFTLVFTALGASVGLAGTQLLEHRHALEIAGGLFVIAMGLVLLGRGVPMFLMQDRRFHRAMRPATLIGAGIAGAAFAFGWTPCIGPTLGAALTLAAGSGSWLLGGSLLMVYGLGLGIPFLLAGLFIHQATSAMGILKGHVRLISQVGAVLLIVFGILMVTGLMTRLNIELAGWSPALM
jgi:cytochrome c-type biogenesis protein